MKISVNDFFKPVKTDNTLSDSDYVVVARYIDLLNAVSRLSNASLYLVDYNARGFLYVSDNPLFLCGYTPEEVKELGYTFYLNQVPEQDLQLLLEINTAGFQFFEKLPLPERTQYIVSYDFHLKNRADHTQTLINHKLTPLEIRQNGEIWLALCMVSHSTNRTAGNILLQNRYNGHSLTYNRVSKKWKKMPGVMLSNREKEIIQLSFKGYSSDKIAENLFISKETVKFHKKNIFRKLNVTNITQAVSVASRDKII
ncbi:response regulator transcription factor [Niabella drilacis]|uniref:Regulatory protein, luxR family n=1 Tax=Niabella drilacis (strain DSM 25811 / CCM 8410 / CCUG 62505 / LMG 26954 / E90) TaxID=1285928 RepID=A0A1G6NHY3_NIADE|nr:helix-turn-helix transcriptional regulator [Niabella drilacis]SDC66725.1 regulatory protein, luxR family [Niabella drilacis]